MLKSVIVDETRWNHVCNLECQQSNQIKDACYCSMVSVMNQCREKFQIRTPSSMMIVGPSGSGKTHFTERLLCYNLYLFQSPPKAIHYCYGAWQD